MGVRTHPILTNFRRGEVSPRMYGRVDWDGYQSSCVTLENFIILPQGGVTRRPGSRFVAEVKDSSKAVRLIPFRVSDTDIYVLEFGDQYIRFYKNGARLETGGVPTEVSSPFLEADLFSIHYSKLDQTLAFVNANYPPQKLTQYSDTAWRLTEITWDPTPSMEYGTRPDILSSALTLTPAATTGTNVAFTAGANIFLIGDVGRDLIVPSDGSQARITVVDSQTQVHADILQDFVSTSEIAADKWYISGSPQVGIAPSIAGPLYATTTLTLGANGLHGEEYGRYILMSGGVLQIMTIASGTSATARVLVELENTTAQPAGAWSLEEAAWSTGNGYPATVGSVENRLAFGGSTKEPNTIWLSASYDFTNFALGSTDDSAIIIRASSGENSRIRWFSARRKFLMGTASEEFIVQAQNDAAFTPSNVKPVPITPHGSNFVMPLRLEYATIFVSENGRLLRELAYTYEVDDYRAPNLLDISEHLTRFHTIEDIAFQRPPDSIIWAARSDGTLLGCTYLREQDLVAWHRHVTDGEVESVCTIPSEDGTTEELWMIVKRTINGETKRFVEYLDSQYDGQWPTAPGLVTDCAVTVENVTATNIVTGLDHLNGETVEIVGDGAIYPPAIVSGGSVTLQGGTAKNIEIGLLFQSTLQTVRPEIPTNGTSQGQPKAFTPILARFENTIGGHINDQIVSSSTPPVLFSGDKRVDKMRWDNDAWITVEQRQPLPMTLLSITGTIAVGD